MADFIKFKNAVKKNFENIIKDADGVFRVNVKGDMLWSTYLKSFPAGTNPIFRERTEHDCNCCRVFIRDIGNLVVVKNGELKSIWDVKIPGEDGKVYQPVADALKAKVEKATIEAPYLHYSNEVGTSVSRELFANDVIAWEHFHLNIPQSLVCRNDQIDSKVGTFKTNKSVLKRTLEEISPDAIDIVLELIDQNSIYRGQEHKHTVQTIRKLSAEYRKLKSAKAKDIYLATKAVELGNNAKLRNTVIGTLLVDISIGVDLEQAVKSFENKVAPHNYKRSSALITQGMIKKAQEKVQELGIEESLYRRYAVESDLTINNVLFADRSVQPKMGGVFDDIKPSKGKSSVNMSKVEEVSMEDFITKILPKCDSVEVFVENRHRNNFVSLVAPKYEGSVPIFKWGNNFSWSYNGEVTDSIKEKVKCAGGNVTGDVRVSLAWFNTDDLDLSVVEPDGYNIYFGNKVSYKTRGQLDVDMNANGRLVRDAVENIVYPDRKKMTSGEYVIKVKNFNKRENDNVGFTLETEIDGNVLTFNYAKPLRDKGIVEVARIIKGRDGSLTVKPTIESTASVVNVWGVDSQNFHKVKMVMNSPNHWDGEETGNKHWFFMLEDCTNPDQTRGFYNEFLKNELVEHRKVFEVLASKMKVDHSDQQLSGLGFSSTKKDAIICRVSGSFNRTLKVNI